MEGGKKDKIKKTARKEQWQTEMDRGKGGIRAGKRQER